MTAELEDLLVSTHRDEQRLPVLRLLGHAYHAAGESAFDRLELARRYESPRHVSRVQRMYDRLALAWSHSEPALIELHDALAA